MVDSRRLTDLPGYWINLDRSTSRAESFQHNVGQYWTGPLTRISAVEGDMSDPAEVFAWTQRRLPRPDGSFKTKFSDRTLRHSARTRGGLLSHYKTLEFALCEGHERFVVFEDDAALRMSMFELTEEPPEDAWILGWGGVPMLGLKSDDRDFEKFRREMKPNKWKPLRANSHFHGTHCYEITRDAAEELAPIYKKAACAADIIWHEIFAVHPCYKLQVQACTQIGGTISDITGKVRTDGLV